MNTCEYVSASIYTICMPACLSNLLSKNIKLRIIIKVIAKDCEKQR